MMRSPVPVLLLVRELGIGGCERDLSRVACHLDRSRFEPHVGCFLENGLRSEEIREAGVPVVRFPVRSFGNRTFFEGLRRLRAYVRDNGIKLVHCFDTPMNIFGAPLRFSPGRPRILLSALWLRDCIQPRLHQRLLRLTDPLADAFISNSSAARQEMIHRFGRSPERVLLCYNGVDTTQFHPRGRAPRPSLDGSRLVIGTLCALRPEKRVDALIEAFSRLRPAELGLRLLVVGSGPLLDSLELQASRLGVRQCCVFEPAREKVADCLRSMDVFALPSETESFPNALLEAMACGCSVVASSVGGIPELIRPGLDGILVPPSDIGSLAAALAELIERPERRTALGSAAAEKVARCFSRERNLCRTQEIYSALLEGRLPQPLPTGAANG